jgi:diguanylate cyclase
MLGIRQNDNIWQVANKAFDLMDEHQITPTPKNFELWFAFCADIIPDLTRKMAEHLEKRGTISFEVGQALHEQFFGSNRLEDTMEVAGGLMERSLERIQKMVAAANVGASRYGKSLEKISAQISETHNPDELKTIIGSVHNQTAQMVRMNGQLEKRLLASTKEIQDLRGHLKKLREEAYTDGLTQLGNRRAFDKQLENYVKDVNQNSGFLTVILTDIDHFKKFNDTYGHPLGDQVLRLVARCVQESVGDTDFAARYGGEEFVVLLPGSTLAQAIKVAEKIRGRVAGKTIFNRKTNQDLGQVTLSLGVAEYTIGESADHMVRRADDALYLAKREGRNCVRTQQSIPQKADPAGTPHT